jgi:hypothetical protein
MGISPELRVHHHIERACAEEGGDVKENADKYAKSRIPIL